MNKILITGGAGFIGSNLAKVLVKDGNKVYIVDDLSMGQTSNIKDLNVKFFKHTVTDKNFMHNLLKNINLIIFSFWQL